MASKEEDLEFEEPKKKGFFGKLFSGLGRGYGWAASKREAPKETSKKLFQIILWPIIWIVKWVIFIFGILLAIVAGFLILLTILNFATGGGFSIVGTGTSIFFSETAGPLGTIINPVKNFVSDPVGTIAQFGTFKSPTTVEAKKPQGIEFRNFEAKKQIYREGEGIESLANVKIYALEDSSTQVVFSCLIEDQQLPDEEIKIFGEQEGVNTVNLFAQQDKHLNVQCTFPGQNTEEIKIIDKTIDKEKKTVSKKLTLRAEYKDFVARTRLKSYTLENNELANLESESINPFLQFKINDQLISSDRSVRSEQIRKSPAVLSLNLLDAQPLTSGPSYLLIVKLDNDKSSWNGKISKIDSLTLIFPEGFEPVQEDCKEFSVDGNVARLKSGIASKLKDEKDGINNQQFACAFKIDDSAVNEGLSFSLINAEAKFDYTFEAYAAAFISKNVLSSSTT